MEGWREGCRDGWREGGIGRWKEGRRGRVTSLATGLPWKLLKG